MSLRRGWTVSPWIGWPLKASPSAVQSFSVPVSKSRFSGLPSAPRGNTPSGGSSARAGKVESERKAKSERHKKARFIDQLPRGKLIGRAKACTRDCTAWVEELQ